MRLDPYSERAGYAAAMRRMALELKALRDETNATHEELMREVEQLRGELNATKLA